MMRRRDGLLPALGLALLAPFVALLLVAAVGIFTTFNVHGKASVQYCTAS